MIYPDCDIFIHREILETLIIVLEIARCRVSFFNEPGRFSSFICELFFVSSSFLDFETFSLDDVETLTLQISCPVNCIATRIFHTFGCIIFQLCHAALVFYGRVPRFRISSLVL